MTATRPDPVAPRTKRGQWLLKELHGLVRGGWTPFREEQWTGTILAIEAEAAAAPDSLREALERLLDQFDYWVSDPRPAASGASPVRLHKFSEVQPEMERAIEQARAALAAPTDKASRGFMDSQPASEPPRAVELLQDIMERLDWMADVGELPVELEVRYQAARSFLQDSDSGADPPAASLSAPATRESGLDVERLAAAIRSVDFRHNKSLVWAAADNIAEAVTAEYARLSNSQKSEG